MKEYRMKNDTLICESISSKLLFFIYSWIGASVILFGNSIYELLNPEGAKRMALGIGIVGIAAIIILICLIVAFCIWIFRVHKDLNRIFPDYDISPKKSMAMTLIPFYNIWGLWKLAKEIFDKFKLNTIYLEWGPFSLDKLYVYSIAFGGLENVLNKVASGEEYKGYDISIKLLIQISVFIVGIIGPILWYIILDLVMKGMRRIQEESIAKKLI
jgi:hypothetical protein